MLNCSDTAAVLREWDHILILSHASPDGDTLGSACALMRGLVSLGKQVDFRCGDEIPAKFDYLFEGLRLGGFQAEHIMTVDVADLSLLGNIRQEYEGKIELAIDHHGTHRAFTENRWVEPDSAATAEMIWLLLKELGVTPDKAIADCVYTGISTDTGCFCYRNVTSRTLRIAAETMDAGADAGEINRRMFECKSRVQMDAERLALDSMEYFCGGKCAMIRVPQSVLEQTGAKDSELDGVAALPRQIEGVLLGVTVKEKESGEIKVSVRANPPADAAAVCQKFGGGGHTGAAGCSFPGLSMDEAAKRMAAACGEYLKAIGQIQ